MSATYFWKTGALVAITSMLLGGLANAQQQQFQQDRPDQSATDRQSAGQFDRQRDRAGGASQEVEQYLANCLLQKNKAEVEISRMASQEAESPEVKQFAQKIAKDHQKLSQKLQQVAGSQATSQQRSNRTDASDRDDPGTRTDQLRQDNAQNRRNELRNQRNRDQAQRQPGTSQRGATSERSRKSGSDNKAVKQLAQIDQQITQKVTKAMTEQLREKSGAKFDQAYLGCQIGSHTQLKAALEVIEQQTSGEMAQIAQQAGQQVEQHLQEAKELMKKTESQARQATLDSDSRR